MTHTCPRPRRGTKAQFSHHCRVPLFSVALIVGTACGVPENTSVLGKNQLSPGEPADAPAMGNDQDVAPGGTLDNPVGVVSPGTGGTQPGATAPSAVPNISPGMASMDQVQPVNPTPAGTGGQQPAEPEFVDGAGLGSVPVGVSPSSPPAVSPSATTPPAATQTPAPTNPTEPTPPPTNTDPFGGGFGGQQPAPTMPAPSSTDNPPVPGVTPTSQEPDVAPGQPSDDTWTVVYAIFQAKCGGAFCHAANQLPPQLVGEEAIVLGLAEARAADIAAVSGVRMPPVNSGMTLTTEEEQAIQDWAMSL